MNRETDSVLSLLWLVLAMVAVLLGVLLLILAVMFKRDGMPAGLLGAMLLTAGARTLFRLNRSGLSGTPQDTNAHAPDTTVATQRPSPTEKTP
jgi:hypothetical protein